MNADESLDRLQRKLETTQNIMERQKLLKSLWRLTKEIESSATKAKRVKRVEEPTAA